MKPSHGQVSFVIVLPIMAGLPMLGCANRARRCEREHIDIRNVFGEPDVVVERYANREFVVGADGRSSNSRYEVKADGSIPFPEAETIWIYRSKDLEVVSRTGELVRVGPLDDDAREYVKRVSTDRPPDNDQPK